MHTARVHQHVKKIIALPFSTILTPCACGQWEAEPSSFDLAVLTCALSLEFFVTVATDIRASCLIDPGHSLVRVTRFQYY
jgi:hypothetical protein